jgi:hexosaminidase
MIDLIALYKINILHLHLSDDQGWRIEIKKYPKLARVGGQTQVGGGKGGYYTQKEYTEIVNYAADRYITIVPEIDMPGHTNAALFSYPELNCSKRVPKLYTGKRVGFSSLCTSREGTYKFVSDVLKELSALTPGPYLHIGGDESNATKLPAYIHFENRVQQIVRTLGKTAIGWDEISKADLKGGVVQYWSNAQNALRGVQKGAKVIMSPASYAYMDMKYNPETELGLHWAGYVNVDKAFNWDPASLVPGIEKENILGVEAPLGQKPLLL